MNGAVFSLPNELALVARAAVEPAAFAEIYDHYFPRVYNYVRFRVSDPQTTDDLTALIFERILRNIGHYQPERSPFGAWAFAIARNAVNDHLRKQRRRRWISLEALGRLPSPKPDPEQAVIERESSHQVLRTMGALGSRERDLIALKFAGGLSNLRIAELTGLSQSHVGVILYRAIKKLRAGLKDEGLEQNDGRKRTG